MRVARWRPRGVEREPAGVFRRAPGLLKVLGQGANRQGEVSHRPRELLRRGFTASQQAECGAGEHPGTGDDQVEVIGRQLVVPEAPEGLPPDRREPRGVASGLEGLPKLVHT